MIIEFNKIEGAKQNKRKDKAIAKLYRKLKLTNATEKEINMRLLEYVKAKKDIYGFCLTTKQQNDPEFMLKIYKANPQTLSYFIPTPRLQNNIDFMVEFVKLEYARRVQIYNENKLLYDLAHIKPSVDDILLSYRQLRQNRTFMEKINKEIESE